MITLEYRRGDNMAKKTPAKDTLKAPFPYMGGKSKIAEKVWSLLDDPKYYMEPFSGSAAVLLKRPPAKDNYQRHEIINDAEHFIANFWRAVKHTPDDVIYHSDYPINETELHSRHLWLVNEGKNIIQKCYDDPDFYDAKVAGWWVWGISQWIGSGWCQTVMNKKPTLKSSDGIHKKPMFTHDNGIIISNRRPSVGHEQGVNVTNKMPEVFRTRGIDIANQIPQLKEKCGVNSSQASHLINQLSFRLRNVKVLCGNWDRVLVNCILKSYKCGVFLDPPYRDHEHCYNQKVVNDEVQEFCEKWQDKPNVKIVLCGYEGEYDLPKWTTEKWKASTSWGGQNTDRFKETLWISPSCAQTKVNDDMFSEEIA